MRDLSMHILDIVGNSVRAKSTEVKIILMEDMDYDILSLRIEDNGCGMSEATIKKAMDPFFTSRKTRKVGLGIPLLQQNAELTNGGITIESEIGKGTQLTAVFVRSHIDRPPLGDIADTIALIISGNPNVNIIYSHSFNDEKYILTTKEIINSLENVSISHPKINQFIKQMIEENLELIGVEL
ncbi:ATP-binding protein [Saccharicrinis aurantiacus]|uniref:ATP-binding protein n=1 Tax=Saccharicrinis aurantiacus TaxID=1849719 RepID=UPI00094FB7A4|nr:ATP-binding protein [Saccharicrinis aurantiacus]